MKCTHIALQVRDIEQSIQFYRRYLNMCIVHERDDDGTRVAWLGWGEDPPKFAIVLVGSPYQRNDQPPIQHIGMAVESREAVEAIYAEAQADQLSRLWPPEDGGEIVGYYCGVADPDGNMIEISYGQRLG